MSYISTLNRSVQMPMDYLSDPVLATLSDPDRTLIQRVHDYTETYFRNPKFDSSHDFKHVMRVVANALSILRRRHHQIYAHSMREIADLDRRIIILGALLHDVGDRKYVDQKDADTPLVRQKLIEFGLTLKEASVVQDLVDGVSYSAEVRAPEQVQALIQRIPELAVVQDADRLDAIGAIGIGRCFTFGGARHARSLEDSIQHFEDKLLKLEGMMKTEAGRALAVERSARIKEFMRWWRDETALTDSA